MSLVRPFLWRQWLSEAGPRQWLGEAAEFHPPVGWPWSKCLYAVISVMTTSIGTGNSYSYSYSYTRMGAIIMRRNA